MVVLVKTRHHLYFPAFRYNRPDGLDQWLTKSFRELPCNQECLLIDEHEALHDTCSPPEMPSVSAMKRLIRKHMSGKCRCRRRPDEGAYWVLLGQVQGWFKEEHLRTLPLSTSERMSYRFDRCVRRVPEVAVPVAA